MNRLKTIPASGSKKSNRSIWFRLHFWIGWIAALPIALICLTGGILVFEDEIFQWEHQYLYQLEVTGTPLSVGEVLETYQSADPPLQVNHLEIPTSPQHSYGAYCTELRPEGNRSGRVFLNPYSGDLTRLTEGFSIGHTLIDIHRHLAAGKVGQQLVAISSLVLAITCMIGLILWWPLRGRTFVRAWKRGQALDWHNALGLVALIPLIIMAITGITFTWGPQIAPLLENLRVSSAQPPGTVKAAPAGVEKLPIDPMVEKALSLMPDVRWSGFQPSNQETSPHKFFFDGEGAEYQLVLDPFTGEELMRVDGSVKSNGPVSWYIRNFGRLHTMGAYNLVARILWGLLSIGGTVLVMTGLWVSVKRWRRLKPRI